MSDSAAALVGSVIMMLLPLVVLGVLAFIIYRLATRRGRQANDASIVEADGGKVIPVAAAFAGIEGLPWWFAIATNNANPSLVIYPSGIRYRMIRKHQRSFADMARVDVRTAWKTVNIEMHFHGEPLTFSVNVRTVEAARAALQLLPASVALTSRARAVVSGQTN